MKEENYFRLDTNEQKYWNIFSLRNNMYLTNYALVERTALTSKGNNVNMEEK